MSGTHQVKDRSLDWLTLVVGPLVLVLLLALGVEARPGNDVNARPAPGFPEKGWLNTPENKPLRIEDLRGKVVLVEFWTFACYNCRNQLPYVKAWHEKYGSDGLVVVGVHTPEFDYESKPKNVQKAVEELGIRFPVVLDNDFATWKRFRNQYWPAVYLINHQGKIVYVAVGEGDYSRTEKEIQRLLKQAKAARS